MQSGESILERTPIYMAITPAQNQRIFDDVVPPSERTGPDPRLKNIGTDLVA